MSNLVSAYEMGQIARAARVPINRNPYSALRDRMEWEMGWKDEDKLIAKEAATVR